MQRFNIGNIVQIVDQYVLFFLALVFAVTVYDAGPPPAVGVGDTVQAAKSHIDFLKTCYDLNWSKVESDEGISWQIKGAYTVCQSTRDGKTWLTCLFGKLTDIETIKNGIAQLHKAYLSCFDTTDKLLPKPVGESMSSVTPTPKNQVTEKLSASPTQDPKGVTLPSIPNNCIDLPEGGFLVGKVWYSKVHEKGFAGSSLSKFESSSSSSSSSSTRNFLGFSSGASNASATALSSFHQYTKPPSQEIIFHGIIFDGSTLKYTSQGLLYYMRSNAKYPWVLQPSERIRFEHPHLTPYLLPG